MYRSFAALGLFVMALCPAAVANPAIAAAEATHPQAAAPLPAARDVITVTAGSGHVLLLGGVAASVFVADPKIAEARPASPTSLFIFGVAPGRTTVAALTASGGPLAQYEIIVKPSGYGAAEAQAGILRAVPGSGVRVETEQNGLALTGEVTTAADADHAVQIAKGYLQPGQTLDNRLSVLASLQVNLRVRIAEMSRNVIRQLGVNWANLANLGKYAQIGLVTSNPLINLTRTPNQLVGGYNFPTPGHVVDINALIDALSQDELIHVLAEPNLTAISGESASFLVGGEFPIPVAQQNNTTTIEFKQFGVSLAFVPTLTSDGRITLKVRPEVSQLSNQGAVQLSSGNSTIQVPALTVRRAETTVQLGSGQSFAIAGLLQDNVNVTSNGVPIVGDVPVLGALFRSDNFQRNETELVIVVTPYIVRPVSDPASLRLPTDGWRPPSDLERILLLRQSAAGTGGPPGATGRPVSIPGNAGFIMQ
jgi:pilus assembly protein CpaC